MALTRITKGVIKPNENYDTHNINSTGIVTAVGGNFTGDLTVGGVLTYEDVTSIDSVGIITAQKGIHVGAGISVVGVSTFNSKIVTSDEIDIGSSGNPGRIRLHNGSGGHVFQVASIGGNLTLRSSNGGVRADDNIGRPLFFGSPGGAFNIYHSGNKKLETLSKGIKVGSGVTIETNGQATFVGLSTHSEGIFVPDDKSIRVGGTFDNPDFKIHSSSTYQQAVVDYNRSGTGRALRIRATNLQIENWNGLTPTVKVIGGVGAGHVELNYAGNKKFETTNTGVVVSGILTATSFSGDGSSLSNLPASAPVGGASTNSVFFENDTAVAVNYQITTGKNAMSAGPIAINAGIAVTVPSGSSWTIV